MDLINRDLITLNIPAIKLFLSSFFVFCLIIRNTNGIGIEAKNILIREVFGLKSFELPLEFLWLEQAVDAATTTVAAVVVVVITGIQSFVERQTQKIATYRCA